MTLKSTQFIGSARCPELNSNPSVSSNENAFTSYFCIHNEPMTFDLWPYEPIIYSVHWLCKIHKWSKFGRNPSICSNDNTITSYFCIHNVRCDLWPLTSWPPKSNQFIGSASNIHDLSLAEIHQSVLEITRSRAVFAYIMSPVTFDLWPSDPKI